MKLPASEDPAREGTRAAVLFVMPWRPDGAGGVNRVVLNLMAGFAADTDYRPLLLVNAYPQRKVVRRQYEDLPLLYEFFLPPPFDEKRVGRSLLAYLVRLPVTLVRFIGLIKREKIVTVNLQYPSLSAFTVLLARFVTFGAFNVVLSFHGADLPRRDGSPLARLTWRFVLRRSDAIVACSRALANELRRIRLENRCRGPRCAQRD